MELKEHWHTSDQGKKDKNERTHRGPRRVRGWSLGERLDRSFAAIKREVIGHAVYGGSDHKLYHLATDASKTDIGGLLFQLIDCDPGTRI